MSKQPDISVAIKQRPKMTLWATILIDWFAVVLAGLLVVGLRELLEPLINNNFQPYFYLKAIPGVAILHVLFLAGAGLYPGLPANPPREMKRLFFVTIALGFGIATATMITRESEFYSRFIIFGGCVSSMCVLFFSRSLMRWLFAKQAWWGLPIVVVGSGRDARSMMKHMLRNPEIGIKPVAFVDDRRRNSFVSIPYIGQTSMLKDLIAKYPKLYLMVIASDLASENLRRLINEDQTLMRHVIIIPDLHGVTSYGVQTSDIGGTLGIYVQQRLLDPWRMSVKRTLDLFLILISLPFLIPIFLLLGLAIVLDSKGGVFYGHERLGRGAKPFTAWKFRTMVPNAAEALEAYLKDHPELREEWEKTQKLKNDPRVSRVGKWLRRTSMDELPQLFNVLLGQMSLVGPRPIVEKETWRYGPTVNLYYQVRPGLTGLWQVSGRNDLPYRERVRLDARYIRNWSVWMDLYIIIRTFGAVLRSRGAY